MVTRLLPVLLLLETLVAPMTCATALSMTWVTCLSTAAGLAPAYEVLMLTTGMLMVGSRSTPSDRSDTKPNTTMPTKMPIEKT